MACSGSDEAIDPGPAGESVGSVSDFEDGAFVARTSTGLQIVVLDVDGEVRAFTAVCPHANCTVRLKEGMLDCPCHGSLFSTDDGSVQRGPAREGLEPVAVTLDGDSIVLSSSAS